MRSPEDSGDGVCHNESHRGMYLDMSAMANFISCSMRKNSLSFFLCSGSKKMALASAPVSAKANEFGCEFLRQVLV